MKFRFKNFRQFGSTSREIRLPVSLLADPKFRGMTDTQRGHFVTLLLGAVQSANRLPWDPAFLFSHFGLWTSPDLDALEQAGIIEKIPERETLNVDSSRASRYIPDAVKAAIIVRDGGRCVNCRRTDDLQIDHIVPIARGGVSEDGNLQTLCGRCNRRKSKKMRAGL